jgi:hypothetical protein
VSRLYDRIRQYGTRPLTAADLHAHSGDDAALRAEYADEARARGLDPPDDAIDELVRASLANATRAKALTPPLAPGIEALPDMPVVVADNVGRYLNSFGPGTRLDDLVSVVRPPFDEMWVDVQHVPTPIGMNAWGIHLGVDEDGERFKRRPDDRWVVIATIFGEWRKNDPVGPLAQFVLPLTDQGRLRDPDAEGHGAIFGGLVEIEGMAESERYAWTGWFKSPLGAGLLAISFMHCKNVDVREVRPADAVAKKRRKRHGIPPTRYYVLDIAPMTGVLARDGDADATGLRNALHICRGHFKTFSPDAPLFGQLTGTFWWSDHVRGDAAHGTIEKDYRIRIEDEGLGETWGNVDEHTELNRATESTGLDPDLAGRGLRAHNTTLNMLAAAVKQAGHDPRRPKPSEPQYDTAWDDGDAVWVAEVKSLTTANEERQLRLALGQVLRYRQLLDAGTKPVRAVIAAEQPPTDGRWLDLCSEQGVVLVWPAVLVTFLPPIDSDVPPDR